MPIGMLLANANLSLNKPHPMNYIAQGETNSSHSIDASHVYH